MLISHSETDREFYKERNESRCDGSKHLQPDNNNVALYLTHLPLDIMSAILADDSFKCIFLNENDRIRVQISLKFVPRGSIDNKSALVQVMVWRRSGYKPFPEPMMTLFTDAYMRHKGEIS